MRLLSQLARINRKERGEKGPLALGEVIQTNTEGTSRKRRGGRSQDDWRITGPHPNHAQKSIVSLLLSFLFPPSKATHQSIIQAFRLRVVTLLITRDPSRWVRRQSPSRLVSFFRTKPSARQLLDRGGRYLPKTFRGFFSSSKYSRDNVRDDSCRRPRG